MNENIDTDKPKTIREELLYTLAEMITNIEKLPPYAMTAPITHYDHCALLILLKAIFEIENGST